MADDTNIFVKVGEGIGQSLLKGIGMLLLGGGIFGGSVAVSHHDAKQEVWEQAGDNLHDKTKAIQALELTVSNLQSQIDALKPK